MHLEGQHGSRSKAEVDTPQLREAREQETSADGEDERQCDLRRHERGTKSHVCAAARAAATFATQYVSGTGARRAHRRRRTKEHGTERRERDGEEQKTRIERQGRESRNGAVAE